MPPIRSISIALRNVMSRFYPLFSCCASCGEIKVPLGNRLCTSLQPHFEIDAVFLRAPVSEGHEIRKRMPWLGTLFFIGHSSDPIPENLPRGTCFIPETVLSLPQIKVPAPAEAMLHTLALLSEHYLVFPAAQFPEGPCHPLDFFSPNGIPLIPSALLVKETESLLADNNPLEAFQKRFSSSLLSPPPDNCRKPYPQTRSDSSLFWNFVESCGWNRSPDISAAYGMMLQQWLFLSGKGIPVPGA